MAWLSWFLLLLQCYCHFQTASSCDGSRPLGMSTGAIGDRSITASSTYPTHWDAGCDTRFARVLRAPPAAAWCSASKSASEWLQIDLGFPSKITSVATQGRTDGREWVTAFRLSYSSDGSKWHYVKDSENDHIRVFAANADSHSVKHSYLENSIIARFVKFHPVKWHGHPSMRVEVYGCQNCRELINVQPWAQVQASSQWLGRDGNRCRIENAFLYSSGAWCPKKRDKQPWLEYDFGTSAVITAVGTRGREPVLSLDDIMDDEDFDTLPVIELTEGSTFVLSNDQQSQSDREKPHKASRSIGRPQWVSGYKLFYRNTTSDQWQIYSDFDSGETMTGNNDASSVKLNFLNKPILARFIRLVPVQWVGYPSMRVALFGCPNLEMSENRLDAKSEIKQLCPENFVKPGAETPCVENLAFGKKAWAYMKRHHKRHLPSVGTTDYVAQKAVDGNVNSSQHTCMPLNNAQIADPTWVVDVGRKAQISGVRLWLWHPSDNASKVIVEKGLRWLDKITVFVTAHPTSRATLNSHDHSSQLCSTVKNFDNRFAKDSSPIHFICSNALVGRYIYVVATGLPSSDHNGNKFHTSICEVMAYS